MPIYKAPVEDVNFLLNDVFQIDRYDNLPGFTDASADVREAILGEAAKLSEEVLQPLNRVGDLEGCVRHDDGSVTTPKGFKEAFKQVAEGGWLGLSAPTRIWRAGTAGDAEPGRHRIPVVRQYGVFDVWRPDHGRDRGADRARQARTEEDVRAEDGGGRMDRHHEPDRAAMRHRSGPVAHQGGQAGRRQLQDHGHQDLHLGRRARSRRQHHPSGAGPDRGRARRHQGRVAVRGAENPGQCRRLAGRAQRRVLRLDRAQDGHPRQFHLRDELRRRHRLADRRREQGHAGHVRDDERGPARRRGAGAGAIRSRLPERGRLCPRPPAGPRAVGRRRRRTSRPIRSSCIPTCAARCSPSAPSTRRRARWWCGPR